MDKFLNVFALKKTSVTFFPDMLFYITMNNLIFLNNLKKVIACGLLLAVLMMTSCNWDPISSSSETFDYDLRGTWVSNDYSVFSGKLEITRDRITIIGYTEDQTNKSSDKDDNKRPFREFIKGAQLVGYSENNKFFIRKSGSFVEIPYIYETAGNYPKKEFLEFNFGGRPERLEKQ